MGSGPFRLVRGSWARFLRSGRCGAGAFLSSVTSMADFNVFQFCKCLKLLGKVMVLVVLAFVALSYYAVVFATYGPAVLKGDAKYATLAALAVILVTGLVYMILLSYFTALSTDPGRVPEGWHPFSNAREAQEELARIANAPYDPESRLAGLPRPRYCRKCQAWKPPRAHHDSVTGRCVLKMDHYCVWLLNCIGLLNYKAFLLFLLWSFLGCTICVALLVGSFIRFFRDGDELPVTAVTPILFVALVIDAAFALSLLGFLIMHANLLLRNCTTVEMYEKRRTAVWPYDNGARQNFLEVFGTKPARWLWPTHTEEERRNMLDVALNRGSQEMALACGV